MPYSKKAKAQDPSYKLKRKKSNRKVATTQLFFVSAVIASGTVRYIDLAQSLSIVNRKMNRQGQCFAIHSVVAALPNTTGTSSLDIETIPDTWVANNAWVKAYSLWAEMNQKVLQDNPSVQGKWRDFKVFFDAAHYAGGTGSAGPTLNMIPRDSDANLFDTGEWAMSEFVRPQHEVVQATGLPKAADQFYTHMLGADDGSTAEGSALNSGGIIQMYQETRARVVESPVVPAGMSTNWGTLLTDDGSQEPELADVIEDESDDPPYNLTKYPGSGTATADAGTMQIPLLTVKDNYPLVSSFNGFLAPFGLLKLTFVHAEGESGSAFRLWINLVPGKSNGVHAIPMGQ